MPAHTDLTRSRNNSGCPQTPCGWVFCLAWFLPLIAAWAYMEYRIWHPIIHPHKETLNYCPLPGYSLPPPARVHKSDFPSAFEEWSNGCPPLELVKSASWFHNTTFAIKASIAGTTVLECAHRPNRTYNAWNDGSYAPSHQQPMGTGKEDPLFDTKSRVASVTKVFTVLAVLLSKKIGWEDSIVKYVPDLDVDAYQHVTIGALAEHTSGLGRFGYVGDLSLLPGFSPEIIGVRRVDNTLPGCDLFPGGRVCTPQEVIDMFNNPSFRPSSLNSPPLYSNIAFVLLGLALSNTYSKTYEEVIQELILDPLTMSSSTFDTPTNAETAILPNKSEAWFVASFGNHNPTGGLWSTPNDMQLFLQALLDHKLLSRAETRKWLQPKSFLPSLHQSTGAPWEIFRPTDLPIKVPRPIDVYTKAGGVRGYASYAVLVPEYGIATTIMAAGNEAETAIRSLLPVVVRPLVQTADLLARLQAHRKYSGQYYGIGDKTSMLLDTDGGPGIKVHKLYVNGVDVLATLVSLQRSRPSVRLDDELRPSARLYPIDADSLGTGEETWRLMLDWDIPERGFAEMECMSWSWGDSMRYAGEPLDQFVFHVKNDTVERVTLKGWRTTMSLSEL